MDIPGYTPIRWDGDRPIFDEAQITDPAQLVPGMIVGNHNTIAGYYPESKELVLIKQDGEWAYFGDPMITGLIQQRSLRDHSVLPYGDSYPRRSKWNIWNFWTVTGKTVSDSQLDLLQYRLLSEFDL